MKYLLLLISFNCFAQQEFNLSYLRVNQNLEFKEPIRFKMDAIQLGYTYWTDYNLGLKLTVARSTETPNSVILYKKYTNKINALWQAHIAYKYDFDKLSVFASTGITEYHTTWWVDGVEPAWSKGTDSHKPSYCFGAQYKIETNFKLESSYCHMYDKDKKGYGIETTDGFNIGITYIY